VQLQTGNQKSETGHPWRRIAWLQFWLLFLPPVGFWMVWRDATFSRTAKGRILVYTYLIPLLAYLALMLYVFNASERALQASGGGY